MFVVMQARLVAAFGVALLGAVAASPAAAQGCPQGTYQTGGGTAGWVGCAPIYDPSADYPVDPDPAPTWARGPSIDPMAGRISAATALVQMQAQELQNLQQRMASDPAFAEAYRRYVNGAWDHFRQVEGAAPGRHCAAMFAREGRIVLLLGPADDSGGALLVFLSPDVPAPDEPREINVALTQTGDTAPQRVKAFNYRMPGTELAAVVLAVPGIDLLLDNMLDQHRFDLTYRNDAIFSAEWTGGLAARDELARCVHP